MELIKNKPIKDSISILQLLFVFLPLFNLNAQNYVKTGGEFYSGNIGYDFTTSSVWQTDRTAVPGYFSWGTGTSYSGLGARNNINGYVKKYGTDTFVFPIGTGTEMRTLSITANSTGSVTDAYACAWIDGNPTTVPDPTNSDSIHLITSVSGVIVSVSDIGQWDWQDFNNTGDGLGITVSIPEIQATGAFTYPANLRLVGWNGTAWQALGTTGATGLANYSTLSGTMVLGIQAIGIGASCSAGIYIPTIQ